MLPLRRAVLASHSPASRSIWNAATTIIQKRHITIQQLDAQKDNRERIVILGSGWAGYTLARDLNPKKYQIVLVSPRSYFAFTPLLASTSVGTLEFRTALEPVRSRRARGEFFQGWGDDVDFDSKTLTVEENVEDPWQGRSLTTDRHKDETPAQRARQKQAEVKKGELFTMKYDKLVVGVGCYNQTFETRGVRENAYFLSKQLAYKPLPRQVTP